VDPQQALGVQLGPSWATGGGRLAYLRTALNDVGTYELVYVRTDIDSDGNLQATEPAVVVDGFDDMAIAYVWGPDDLSLVCARQHRIIAHALDGTQTIILTAEGRVLDLQLAPDGRHIAYVQRDESNTSSVWVAEVREGTAVRAAGPLHGAASCPSWLPDSMGLVFAAAPSMHEPPRVHVVELDQEAGADARSLAIPGLDAGVEFVQPSPSGEWLALILRGWDWDVHVAHADGSGLRRLTVERS
jgi:Tol biopolymer transport system component